MKQVLPLRDDLVVSSTTLTPVPGCVATLKAWRNYKFKYFGIGTADATSGYKIALTGGDCASPNILRFEGEALDISAKTIHYVHHNKVITDPALNDHGPAAFRFNVEGSIVPSADCTFGPAAAVSSGVAPFTTLQGAYFEVTECDELPFLATGDSNIFGNDADANALTGLAPNILTWNNSNETPLGDGSKFVTPAYDAVPLRTSGAGSQNSTMWAADVLSRKLTVVPKPFLVCRDGAGLGSWLSESGLPDLYQNCKDVLALTGYSNLPLMIFGVGANNASDSPHPLTQAQFHDGFMTMWSNYIADGLLHPLAPIVIHKIKRTTSSAINAAIDQLASEDARILVADVSDLTDIGDGTHFDSASLKTLGQRSGGLVLDYMNSGASLPPALTRVAQ